MGWYCKSNSIGTSFRSNKNCFGKKDQNKKFTFQSPLWYFSIWCLRWFPPTIGWLSPEEVPVGNDRVTDDIIRIWKLWQLHIENNPDETVSDNEFNKALTILLDIGKRLSSNEDFKELGFEFTKEICSACKSNSGNLSLIFIMWNKYTYDKNSFNLYLFWRSPATFTFFHCFK